MKKPHVVIVGGGIAGMMAAHELLKKCEVTIIESRSTLGGRIRSIEINRGEGVIEEGAEFVHGDLPITKALAKEAGLQLVKIDGKMFRKEKKVWKEETEMIEGWEELVEKMKTLRKDVTMHEFMEKHFAGNKYDELRLHIRMYVQGFDLAAVENVSAKSLYREWSNEEDQYRIREGYGPLIKYLTEKISSLGCNIIYGETVKQIDWQKNEVTLYTSSGKKITGEKVIITLPVSILCNPIGSHALNFTPPIDEQISAYRNIGYGSVIKVVFDFKENFWKPKLGFVFSEEMIPTWWTAYPLKNNLLTGWAGGPAADKLASHSNDELLEIGIISLANIFDTTPAKMRDRIHASYIHNWSHVPESLGAYSYSTPMTRNARKLLAKPLEGTVFFSGEGLFEGDYPGTVEAALKHAKTTAAGLIKTLKS